MGPQGGEPPHGGHGGITTVHLFEGPYVTCGGERQAVPEGSKRLLAFVALRRGRVERPYAAEALWPFGDDERAAGNLRSALWRLRRAGIDVIVSDKWSLALADHVVVDVQRLSEWASRLIHGAALPEDHSLARLPADALKLLSAWLDDWVIIERERMRQRVLHAMESLSRRLTAMGRYNEAVGVALTAIAAEPLRESAHRALIETHVAQDNRIKADQAFRTFQALIRSELGVDPSRELAALVATVDHAPVTRYPGRAMTALPSFASSQ